MSKTDWMKMRGWKCEVFKQRAWYEWEVRLKARSENPTQENVLKIQA
jgi:hypothetical protein